MRARGFGLPVLLLPIAFALACFVPSSSCLLPFKTKRGEMSIVSSPADTNIDGQSTLPVVDWSEKSANDLISSMLTTLPCLCWLELNADYPTGLYYHPALSVNNLLHIDVETLQELLGGGPIWGKGIDWKGCLFRATGGARLQRSTGTKPIFIYLDPSGRGPLHPFQGPG